MGRPRPPVNNTVPVVQTSEAHGRWTCGSPHETDIRASSVVVDNRILRIRASGPSTLGVSPYRGGLTHTGAPELTSASSQPRKLNQKHYGTPAGRILDASKRARDILLIQYREISKQRNTQKMKRKNESNEDVASEERETYCARIHASQNGTYDECGIRKKRQETHQRMKAPQKNQREKKTKSPPVPA